MWFRVLTIVTSMWHVSSVAAEQVPPHLVGSWGTSESLYVGSGAQNELHLQRDGFGLMAGSTPEASQAGQKSDKPAPRAVMGFPVRAGVKGDTLSLQPFMPGQDQPKELAGLLVTCHYKKTGPTLTCTGPDGVPGVMTRRTAPPSAEVASAIASIRASLQKIPAKAQVQPK